MKRISILLVLTFAFVFAFSGVAYANFGPHGGYWDDTDACAGCHRAHTSFSPIRWTDRAVPDVTRSALLVSSATLMSDFCAACHGDNAPGASTNVVSGIFDSGPSADIDTDVGDPSKGDPIVDPTLYQTNSTFNATLNAGGFLRIGPEELEVTSSHRMEEGEIMWGFGGSVTEAEMPQPLTCTDCHDPHGSSNYRILRDRLNDNTVGGYDNNVPQPFVISAEEGYPNDPGEEGWKKFEEGAAQMEVYRPNYTSPEYAWMAPDGTEMRSMSAWCAGCHEQYDNKSSPYHYEEYESNLAWTENLEGDPEIGDQTRFRHPVNTTLMAATGPEGVRSFTNEVELVQTTAEHSGLPLEQTGASMDTRETWETTDYISCLTCHRAHGTAAIMEEWAEAEYVYDDAFTPMSAPETTIGFWKPQLAPEAGGVNPTFSSALLRFDNRGVCQRCHRM